MLSGRQIALAAGVLLLGVSTALIFQRPAQIRMELPPEGPQVDNDLVLHRHDAPLPLRVQSGTEATMQPVPPPGSDRALASLPASGAGSFRTSRDDETGSKPPPPPMAAYYPAASLPPWHSPATELANVPHRADVVTPRSRQHIIKDGDTLERLAARYLGDPARHMEIFAANQHVLTHPELLPIGVTITIPSGAAPPQPTPAAGSGDALVPVPWRRGAR